MASLNEAWELFKQGVGSVLRQWTALQLAVDNNWGGGNSQQKALAMEAELVEMFRTKKQVYRDEVEDYLNAYLDDHFGTYAEDDRRIAVVLLDMFAKCGAMDFTLVRNTLAQEQSRRAKPLRSVPAEGADDPDDVTTNIAQGVAAGGMDAMDEADSDGDSDGDGGEDEQPQQPAAAAAKAAPAPRMVDPDGWETVTKKKGKGRG
ncbi:Pre-rRNA-processing protein TSR2-domain-containing protein [Tribonema minus]|uniref:Pre-rRNA-processing protein TSR2-domain-containing protein n=1 Tax=Tribonema minus TaxID=303371 RepID=A0A836CB10_9STRA|nr:Pre-rRNA-processing protein TSR2-domain-containing protein [Tribonema minus]